MGPNPGTKLARSLWIAALLMTDLLAAQHGLFNRYQLKTDSQLIEEGLVYYHFHSQVPIDTPISIHVLEADLRHVRFRTCLAQDQIIGQETTSSMVRRTGALAGINGGFSFSNDPWNPYHGDPRDFLMIDGRMLSEPLSTRSSLGISGVGGRQELFFDRIGWRGKICDDTGHCLQLKGVNRQRTEHDLILYTSEWNRTTLTHPGGRELVIAGDTLARISDGSSVIPQEGFVVSASGRYLDSLSQLTGDAYLVEHQFYSHLHPGGPVRVDNTSYQTAGPILLLNGRIHIDPEAEQIPTDFINRRHPRTGVGLAPGNRTIFLVVVDGRQPVVSNGLSLPEFAQFFLEIGAERAYNLDGGGSSTMVVGKTIANAPSDPRERRRCDALLLYAKPETDGN